jgi:hypothetical protein
MTLLINEIHVQGDLHNSFILFAADRRITLPGRAAPKFMKKVVRIPYLNAGIGYYGLAEIKQNVYLAGWLPNFINNASGIKSLGEFAANLRDELNQKVSKTWLSKYPSGFHICGYNANGFPELWHICNHNMQGNKYIDFSQHFGLSEDFLSRDAVAQGYDGASSSVRKPFIQYYINGDVRPFHSAWSRLDEFLAEMFAHGDFRRPQTLNDKVEVVKWKMNMMVSFYEQFANQPIIGGSIDAFTLKP